MIVVLQNITISVYFTFKNLLLYYVSNIKIYDIVQIEKKKKEKMKDE